MTEGTTSVAEHDPDSDAAEADESEGGRARSFRRVVTVTVIVLAVYGAIVAWNVLGAVGSARSGVADLRRAERNLDLENLASGDASVLAPLREAEHAFHDAGDSLGAWWMAPARVFPFVGRQIRGLRDLTVAGAETSGILARTGEGAIALAQDDWSDPARRPTALVEVSTLARDAQSQLARIDPGDGKHLVSAMSTRYDEFVERWMELQENLGATADVALAGAKLLEGPQSTLVLAANNSEMRNGSGMFLSLGILTTQGGSVSLGEFSRASDVKVPEGAVNLDPDVSATWGWMRSDVELRSAGTTPRFDATARQIASMWEASGRGPVDNVMAVDVVALSAFLGTLGPVDVAGRSLGPKEIRRFLLHDQYSAFEDPTAAERQEALGLAAAAVLTELDQPGWKVQRMVRSFRSGFAGRHLMIYSKDPEMQAAWEAAGLSGSIGREDLTFALMNVGGTKLDFFIEARGVIGIGPVRSGAEGPRRSGKVEVTFTNRVSDGEVRYVAGPHPDTNAGYGEYRGVVAWGVPELMSQVALSGDAPLAFAGADGESRVYGGYLAIPPGEERMVTLDFSLPEHGSMTIVSSGRFPPILWTHAGKTWKDVEARTLEW